MLAKKGNEITVERRSGEKHDVRTWWNGFVLWICGVRRYIQLLYRPDRQASQDGFEQGIPASMATRSPEQAENFLVDSNGCNDLESYQLSIGSRLRRPRRLHQQTRVPHRTEILIRLVFRVGMGGTEEMHLVCDYHLSNPAMLPKVYI